MPVIDNSTLKTFTLPGLVHQTVAGPAQGLKTLEVWVETIAPGAGTPVHRHDCEEVFVILTGGGQVTLAGQVQDFGANHTLIVPRGVVHQVVNTGQEDMHLVAVLGAAPARATTPDGQPILVPWLSD
jgi:mannose-6-phosphate isomerase-like protein (cupin superfamily)